MAQPADTSERTASASSTKIVVVLNIAARSGSEQADVLQASLDRHSGRFVLRRVSGDGLGEAVEEALGRGVSTIVAAGGDGTIVAVAERLAGRDATLGIVPLGTFNYMARTLGLPDDMDAAVDVILAGHSRAIEIADVNGRIFLNNASLGAYAEILARREGVYRRWGRSRLAAYWSVLATLARIRRPLTLRVVVDGEVYRVATPLAFVANNAEQLEGFDLAGSDCVREGRFALYIAPDCGRVELLLYALRLAFRTMKPGRDFELICGREIVVESPRRSRRLVARDGERDRMTAPFRFTLRPGALRVLVPKEAE